MGVNNGRNLYSVYAKYRSLQLGTGFSPELRSSRADGFSQLDILSKSVFFLIFFCLFFNSPKASIESVPKCHCLESFQESQNSLGIICKTADNFCLVLLTLKQRVKTVIHGYISLSLLICALTFKTTSALAAVKVIPSGIKK